MNELPHPLALETYQAMLAYHTRVIASMNDNWARDGNGVAACGKSSVHSKLEYARIGQRLAAKLIRAWHKDVADRQASEAAQRAAIQARYRKAR